MSKESLVFDVSDASYGKYVLLNSHKLPAVMMFTGAWSEHCYVQDSIFSRLAEEFAEKFVFARLDIDENPQCRGRYDISSVPTTIVFRDGEIVRRVEGLMEEDEARALLKDYGIYRESDESRMQARASHLAGDTPRAISLLAEAMKSDPTNTRIALDMVQIFIDLRELDEADKLLSRLPQADQDSDTGRGLRAQLDTCRLAANTAGIAALAQRLATDSEDMDAHFDMALCQVAEHNYAEAMSHLFFLLEQQPDYRDGAPREMIVSLINSLTEKSPQMAQLYRRQLATVLNE